MKITQKYLLFLLIPLIVISCEEKKEVDTNSIATANILEKDIIINEDLNISYKVPLDWEKMPAALSEKYVARLNSKKDNLIIYSPKSFYYDDNSSSLLRVGRVSLKDKSISGLLTLDKYIELFKKFNSDLIIQRNKIQLNQLQIIELKIEKGNLISFKIIFHNRAKEIIQLDFSITKENIAKLKSSIDASIKSIRLL